MYESSELHIFLNVALACILTMIIGIERERAHKTIGRRTNMIIGGLTCLMVSLVEPMVNLFIIHIQAQSMVNVDPTRVFQALVVGVSFIGAGAIIKVSKVSDKGFTTAATLLYSSGIGVCTALEKYLLAVILTVAVLAINYAMRFVTEKA